MIDLAWSEIALIAVVALVVIGPKDLPEAVRGVARGIQKLRRMAGEFRSQADELVREANLDELRQQIHDIRNFNVRDEFEKTVDKDGSLRRSFDDPLRGDAHTPPPPSAPAATETAGVSATGAPATEPAIAAVPPSTAEATGAPATDAAASIAEPPPAAAAAQPAAPGSAEPAAVAAAPPSPTPVHRT